MNILLVGSGGREHAMAWKIKQSALCEKLFIAPGNPGTALCGENVLIGVNDFEQIHFFCIKNKIDMVVVGPEEPLVNGIADYFLQHTSIKNIPVIGPNKNAAQLEGSKVFAKQFMVTHAIQTAAYKEFSNASSDAGIRYITQHALPLVLKADGLAAGKGVVICNNTVDAVTEFKLMLSGKFGNAGNRIVVEEFLNGIELTVIILTDGKNYLILPASKDYKKIGEGDTGLNTGGMGAISPPPFATAAFMQKVKEKIIEPTVKGLQKDNILYKGFLYFGLIKVNDEPFLIEYNCRLGDPETQVIIPRIKQDLVDLFSAVAENKLSEKEIETDPRCTATVIMASQGYPAEFEKGKIISGIENCENCLVFHAATKTDESNNLITDGGRVLAVSAYGKNLEEALMNCYANTARIYFETRYFRSDIGWDVL